MTERSTGGFDRGLRPNSAEDLTPGASRQGLAEVFGTWERILCKPDGCPGSLDGRRRKRVLVKIIGE